MFLIQDCWTLHAIYHSGKPNELHILEIRIAVATVSLLLILFVSWVSYNLKKWNSGRDILKSCFETSTVAGWNTITKLKFDVKVAGRCQRAMDRIHHLDKKTVLGGG
jgi:hypothetical protein